MGDTRADRASADRRPLQHAIDARLRHTDAVDKIYDLPTYAKGGEATALLHGREVLDDLVRDVLQVLQDLQGPLPHGGLVVRDPIILAELAHAAVALGQMMSRHGGEEMVLDLVVEAAAEPVDKA